jgi:hypothetical protein
VKDSDYPDISIPKPGESYLCFGMMGEPVEFTYDGSTHRNDLNSCTYTPLKGLIRFQENEDDWEWCALAYQRALAKLRALRKPAEPT